MAYPSVGLRFRLRIITQIPTALPSFRKVRLHPTNCHPVLLSRKVKSTVYRALSRRHVRSTSWTIINWLRKRWYTVCPPIYRCWTAPSQNSQRVTCLGIVDEVSVRFHFANVSENIDIVRAIAEFQCFEDIPRQQRKEDSEGKTKPKVGRLEQKVVVAPNKCRKR